MSGIIDAHVHIWDITAGDYDWITPESFAPLARSFDLDDLRPEREALGVDRVVLVQAADTDGDTDRMLAAASAHPEVAGVVAWVPLDRALRADRLEELGRSGRVVGIRALIHDMPDREWILRPDVAEGLDQVARLGWSFDLVTAGPPALELVPRLVARHPDLRIVIDHLGKPPLRGSAEAVDAWAQLVRRAAEAPTVAAKLSGFAANGADPGDWTADDLRPLTDVALDAFGADRLMLGGDWPLNLLTGGYESGFRRTWEALEVSGAELDAINRGTASTWYRLDRKGAA